MTKPDDTLALAEGIARYVELVHATVPAPELEAMRLTGDLTARRFVQDVAPVVDRVDSYVVATGREIPIRIFDPGGGRARPAVCYFHGGGFALGSVESFDLPCAALAEAAGAVVVSVHYRRLPDADYAAAQADCDTAYAWLIRNAALLGIDAERIGVGGDSVGALLALACTANTRGGTTPLPAFQLLFYGAFAMDPERADYARSRDPLLKQVRVQQYIRLFRECGGLDAAPAPVDRSDLAGLPRTHIVIAEHDPLAGEAHQLAARLCDAGVEHSLQVAKGMIHGFLRAFGVSAAARAELAAAVRTIPQFQGVDA